MVWFSCFFAPQEKKTDLFGPHIKLARNIWVSLMGLMILTHFVCRDRPYGLAFMNVDSQPSFSTAVPWQKISEVLELMDTWIVSHLAYISNIVSILYAVLWYMYVYVYCMVLYDI